MTYNELFLLVEDLKNRTGKASITPKETFNLIKEILLKLSATGGGGGGGELPYLAVTGGTIVGNVFQTGLYTFRNSEGQKPVTFGYQFNNEVGREVFGIANSDGAMSVLGLILAGNLKIGNAFATAKQVWHEGNLTKLSQLQDDLSRYLPLSGGSDYKMQGQIHWLDLNGGTTVIGCPGTSDKPHFFFKSTSYDWRFDKNIKIKTGFGELDSDYSEVWHKGNLTKLSQLENDLSGENNLSGYLPLSGGSDYKMQGQIHWLDLNGGTTAIGCPGTSDKPHFFFKSTSYDWRFDKNIKIKTGFGELDSDYSEVWHKGNLKVSDFVPKMRTINGKPLSDDVTLVARDVGASALGHTHNAIVETYANKTLKFATLTQAQYDAIVTKDPDTLYIITDADAGRT